MLIWLEARRLRSRQEEREAGNWETNDFESEGQYREGTYENYLTLGKVRGFVQGHPRDHAFARKRWTTG